MANTNSNLVTAQAAAMRTPSSGLVNAEDITGVLLFARGEVIMPATPTNGDTLTLVPAEALPVGAYYAPEFSWVATESDAGTAIDIDVGPVSNPDALADALDIKAVGQVWFANSGTLPVALSTPTRITAQEAIIATINSVNTVAQTTIQFCIAYRCKA